MSNFCHLDYNFYSAHTYTRLDDFEDAQYNCSEGANIQRIIHTGRPKKRTSRIFKDM